MKLQIFFLLTHGFVAATVAACAIISGGQASQSAVMAAVCVVFAGIASWFATHRVRAALASLESVVADHDHAEAAHTGIDEFDVAMRAIGKSAARWETAAANTRQQASELQSMLMMLDRRGGNGEPTTVQLRNLLAGLGNSLQAYLVQIERDAAEIEQCTQVIGEGTDAQGEAVMKTTSCVEQLSTTIDLVSGHAAAASAGFQRTQHSATAALTRVRELIEGMKRVRSDAQDSEKKLRGLCDPARQISEIVRTIRDIAARTDLLALNASIESIRAGEHGRGFSIVADEVRKLAEQASHATREITSLIETMQLVTEESIRGVVREREQVDSEFQRAVATEQALELICNAADQDASQIRRITEASTQQLQLAQEVVSAVEQISKSAKANRGGTEKIRWTMKSLSTATPRINSEIQRMRKCGTGSAREGEPASASDTPPAVPVVFSAAPSVCTAVGTGA